MRNFLRPIAYCVVLSSARCGNSIRIYRSRATLFCQFCLGELFILSTNLISHSLVIREFDKLQFSAYSYPLFWAGWFQRQTVQSLHYHAGSGGIGLTVPSTLAGQNQSSAHISSSLIQRILDQDSHLGNVIAQVRAIKRQELNDARNAQKAQAAEFSASLGPDRQRVLELASEKGASSWLTCRPLRSHGFNLSKGEFRDAMCLRYNWLPQRLPTSCQCGQAFSVTHAVSCSLGGFPTLRHKEVRDTIVGLIKQVAHQVTIEPHLQPLSGEHLRYSTANTEDQARLDVAASGIWGGRFDRI